MEGLGLEAEDVQADYDVVLWPDTVESYLLFCDLDDQWLCSPAGFYGLSTPAIESAFRLKGIPRRRWPALFGDIKVMTAGALQAMAENQPKKPQ